MNSSIKARQTRLVNWLAKTLNCKPITVAQTGSYYTEFNTKYTGKSVIRISDHLSSDRTYIHVILSPLNTTVIVNYRNFIWSGNFTNAKSIIYTLIMSKATIEQANPIPNETTPVEIIPVKKVSVTNVVNQKLITKAQYSTLTLAQKSAFKRLIGYSIADGWKKIRKKATIEAYEKARLVEGLTSVTKPTHVITKSEMLRMSSSLQKEILNWINSISSTKYDDIKTLPCETIQISSNQYNKLKPYLV